MAWGPVKERPEAAQRPEELPQLEPSPTQLSGQMHPSETDPDPSPLAMLPRSLALP